ncbi:MAG: response regulator [Candidatus Aquirickettsiella sp.]
MKEEAYQHLLATVVKNARRAVNANNAKSDFISNLSYELRTTLANIIGMAQLLSMDCLLPIQQRYVTDILEASEAILPLVNRLLNLPELEAQHIELQTCTFNLRDLLEKIINQLSYQAGMRRLQLILDYPEDIPLIWIGDPNLIYHILFHLSSHALINTEQGMVVIQVVRPAQEFASLQSEIIFNIKDTGKGMDEAELLELQACFNQFNQHKKRRYKAFNLGLAIILSYLRVLKATLEVESTLGKGSQYICRIPLKELKEPLDKVRVVQTNNLLTSNTIILRILVIEDNEIIQRVYSSWLEKKGILYDIASNAEIALKFYMQHHYDLILIDIALPDSDGVTITQIIRKQETDKEHIPIIALTAHGQPADQQQFLHAGIDEVLIKPIKIEEMNYLLEKWIQPKMMLDCSKTT